MLDDILKKLEDVNGIITKEDFPTVSEILLDLQNIEPLKKKLKALKPYLAQNPDQRYLKEFISACEDKLSRWDLKLDAILVKEGGFIKVDDLPTAVEIVSKPKNIPLLKVKLERLKYWFHSNPNVTDLGLLKSFIENCERGIARAESKKTKYKIPWDLQVNFWIIAVIWIIASAAPAICYYRFFHSEPFYFTAAEMYETAYCNWGALLAATAAVLIYLSSYAILSMVLFRALKSLLVHRRRQLIGEDLPSLVKMLTSTSSRNDPVLQETRKRIMKILLRDDKSEE